MNLEPRVNGKDQVKLLTSDTNAGKTFGTCLLNLLPHAMPVLDLGNGRQYQMWSEWAFANCCVRGPTTISTTSTRSNTTPKAFCGIRWKHATIWLGMRFGEDSIHRPF